MNKIILYHGSKEIISLPVYGKGSPFNDYGLGFYCTEHILLANEWACSEGVDGFVNRYEVDTSDLSILDLSKKEYNILNWLAILLKNRKAKLSTPISKMGRDYLLDNFLIDYEKYDIIIGYRADDSYFSFTRSFISNEISLSQLGRAMRLGKLGEQFVLISKKAFSSIKFLDYKIAENSIYYPLRKERDEKAREAYLKEIEHEDINGIFMRDIIKEKIKNGDSRLQ